MRVLLVHNRYRQPGGEDKVFAAEAALLRSYGHHVSVYEADNRTLGDSVGAAAAVAAVWNRRCYRELRSAIREHRPAVVHFHNTFPLISPAGYYAAHAERAAVVQTLHNYRLLCPGATLFRDGRICTDCVAKAFPWPGVLHGCYRGRAATLVTASIAALHRAAGTWKNQVDAYIVLSEFARDLFAASGLPAGRLSVKPNFVFPDPGPSDLPRRHALFVGRLVPEKGVGVLLAAWSQVGGAVPLRIIGDGPLASEVVRAAAGCPGIRVGGWQNGDETLHALKSAAVLIVPSLWHEPFGMVIAEAFATGLPVIASGGATAMVRAGRTGLHFRAGDADDLAAAVRRLLANGPQMALMQRAAREEFEAKFTGARNHDLLMGVYEEAMGRRIREEAQRPGRAFSAGPSADMS